MGPTVCLLATLFLQLVIPLSRLISVMDERRMASAFLAPDPQSRLSDMSVEEQIQLRFAPSNICGVAENEFEGYSQYV